MKTIRCAAVEDEQPGIDILENYLSHFPRLELTATFTDAFSALEYLKVQDVDILFLDIQLPGITGMEFLKIIRHPPIIIITSAYKEHALEAFDLEVFDYLLKPFSLERFTRAVKRAEAGLGGSENAAEENVLIKEGYSVHRVDRIAVRYVESQKEYCVFTLDDQRMIKSRLSMDGALELLGADKFIRIHRSFIVRKSAIRSVSATGIYTNKETLPLGRSFKELVRDFWIKTSSNEQ